MKGISWLLVVAVTSCRPGGGFFAIRGDGRSSSWSVFVPAEATA